MKTGFLSRPPPPQKKTKKTNKQVFQTPGFDWLKGTWYFMMLALEPPPWRANTSNKKRNEAKKKTAEHSEITVMVVHHTEKLSKYI